jgi:transglutaminase-like putative cysteine protease
MQSASPSGFQLATLPGVAWRRTRQAVPATTLVSALLSFLLILTIAKSTVVSGWVPGIDDAPVIALAGAVLLGILAMTPLPWWLCVAVGFALGPVVAGVMSAPEFKALHSTDPSGLALIQTWLSRVADGSAFSDTAFVLFIITWLMWVAGAWLSWCVLRWRQPLIGLIPGAAAFATNVLNDTDNAQLPFAVMFLVLTFAVLLWSNFTASVANARKARIKMTGDARWEFWETGLVATAALIVLATLLPPLSTVDRTQSMQSSLFQDWAQIQAQLDHPGLSNTGSGGGGTTGFSLNVSLGGPLTKSKSIVFTYTVAGDYPGPRYFRGVNVTVTDSGEWKYQNEMSLTRPLAKSEVPPFGELYQNMALATFKVNMLLPPSGAFDILFYPGQLDKVDRTSTASEVYVPPSLSTATSLVTIDRLSSVPPRSTGSYNVTTSFPNVTEAALRDAGTAYPEWLKPYSVLPTNGMYRTSFVMQYVQDLARNVVGAAGATNPYDQAMAIQNYLRGNPFHYTLTPKVAPTGTDPLYYFLHDSQQGYCAYFATAMGDMLRSLGIPTRLVNGYGPGTYNTTKSRYEVRGEDAHTWVEAYFPNYGWIPFEPTNDTVYLPIQRGSTANTNYCFVDANCAGPTPGPTAGPTAAPNPNGKLPGAKGGGGTSTTSTGIKLLDATTLTRLLAVLLAGVLILFVFASRYLRPRTVMGVWKRTLVLARLAGTEVQVGETPLELGRRLARIFPEASSSIRALASGFVVAAYAPPETAQSARASVMEAWSSLRPLMLRRVAGRFRAGRA